MRKLDRQFFNQSVGADGLITLLLSNVVLVVTAGLFFMVIFYRVIVKAIQSPFRPEKESSLALVAGYLLTREDQIQPIFITRLDRSHEFLAADQARRLYILGGKTGSGDHSEAAAGRDYLIGRGNNPSVIFVEEQSKHTLENLINFRAKMDAEDNDADIYLITSRYHLYRSLVMARGLGLSVLPLAAEDSARLSVGFVVTTLKEAYLLHWYYVGCYWSRVTKNQKSLKRIS